MGSEEGKVIGVDTAKGIDKTAIDGKVVGVDVGVNPPTVVVQPDKVETKKEEKPEKKKELVKGFSWEPVKPDKKVKPKAINDWEHLGFGEKFSYDADMSVCECSIIGDVVIHKGDTLHIQFAGKRENKYNQYLIASVYQLYKDGVIVKPNTFKLEIVLQKENVKRPYSEKLISEILKLHGKGLTITKISHATGRFKEAIGAVIKQYVK